MLPKLYSISETAEYLKISESTARRLIATGKLPNVRVGRAHRITEDALLEFISKPAEPAIKPATPRTRRADTAQQLDREWMNRLAEQMFSSPARKSREAAPADTEAARIAKRRPAGSS
jgi:excisionase family DNA binding protein